MHAFHHVLLALSARVASGLYLNERDETLNGTEVDLGTIDPFEIYPGFFEQNGGTTFSAGNLQARGLQKRSIETVMACSAVSFESPRNWGWIWKEASCDRPNTKNNNFKVDCMGKADHTNIVYGVRGQCRENRVCTEFHGYNPAGIAAWDIYCAEKKTLRQWAIDSKRLQNAQACSHNYVNKVAGNKDVQMSLQVNVLDSEQSNRISPNKVFYTLDGKEVGVERSDDANVGSGVLRVPWGGKVKACVEAKTGQELWAMAVMTAFSVLV